MDEVNMLTSSYQMGAELVNKTHFQKMVLESPP